MYRLVSINDIATILGRTVSTVHYRRRHGQIRHPDHNFNMGPVWVIPAGEASGEGMEVVLPTNHKPGAGESLLVK